VARKNIEVVDGVRPLQWATDQLGCSRYMADTIVELLLGNCNTYPPSTKCRQIYRVGLYDPDGYLIKTLPLSTYGTERNDTLGMSYVVLTYKDTSKDIYIVDRIKLFGKAPQHDDVSGNYYEMAKYVLDAPVSKEYGDTVDVVVKLGHPFTTTVCATHWFTATLKDLFVGGWDWYPRTRWNEWRLYDADWYMLASLDASTPVVTSGTVPGYDVPYMGVKWEDSVSLGSSYNVYYLGLSVKDTASHPNPYARYKVGGQTIGPGTRTFRIEIIQYYSYTPAGPGIPSIF